MGILENFENAWDLHNGVDEIEHVTKKNTETSWDEEFSFEHKAIPITDNVGREMFWSDAGRPENP
jgi:hypothetical protein